MTVGTFSRPYGDAEVYKQALKSSDSHGDIIDMIKEMMTSLSQSKSLAESTSETYF